MQNQPHVLTKSQQAFFTQLGFTRGRGLYLAGGTALALQIQHRQSVDFDFYTSQHFRKGTLARLFRAHLQKYKLRVVRDIDDTFEMNVDPDIHLSCFYYGYPLLQTPRPIQGVFTTSLKDVAAMKIIAIAQRGRRRDFIDIYYLLQKFSLKEILRFTQEKYSYFDIYYGLRGLLYFEDADNDPDIERSMVFDRTLRWKNVKHFIINAVKELQKVAA
ncbi:nucleotidyl transferase AbiEii/AbiGii toxin family protein [Candidatus Uhrbacteria bacterium]|nr:nucleotidyl transferase AbiEii/AbiGii toxin family protein [Candidatus Uhrbacteria bacterium]